MRPRIMDKLSEHSLCNELTWKCNEKKAVRLVLSNFTNLFSPRQDWLTLNWFILYSLVYETLFLILLRLWPCAVWIYWSMSISKRNKVPTIRPVKKKFIFSPQLWRAFICTRGGRKWKQRPPLICPACNIRCTAEYVSAAPYGGRWWAQGPETTDSVLMCWRKIICFNQLRYLNAKGTAVNQSFNWQ